MTEPAPDTSDLLATPEALVRALRGAPVAPDLANDLLTRASAIVRGHCGWHITKQEGVEFVCDGPGTQTLFLPTLALSFVTSVTEDGAAVPTADLEWSTAGMIRRRSRRCWTDRLSGVRVIATHGVEAAPADVAAVVVTLAAKAYANPTGQQSAAAGVTNDGFGPDHGPVSLTIAERNLLSPWRVR